MDRLYSCMEPVHSKGKIRASGVFQRYGTSQVERCSKIIIIIEKFTKCSDRDLQKCVTTTHLAVLWILNSHLKLLIFFLVTYFLILKQTNMVNTEESCWLFFFVVFFEQLKNNRVKQRGSWAEWFKEAPTKWQISRSSPVFVSWNFCLIKGATFSPQNLKGSASIALVQIIGALGPGTVMGKRLTKKLTIFHNLCCF